jgi:hypothetical protein
MGHFFFDDPPVPINEEFEGSSVLCIRGQIEENLPITHSIFVGWQFSNRRRHCLQALNLAQSLIYNTQIDLIQIKMAHR